MDPRKLAEELIPYIDTDSGITLCDQEDAVKVLAEWVDIAARLSAYAWCLRTCEGRYSDASACSCGARRVRRDYLGMIEDG